MKNKIEKESKAAKGKVAVINKKGETKFAKKAKFNMIIESPDDVELVEKFESKLTSKEKAKLK